MKHSTTEIYRLEKKIRWITCFFMIGLVLSGLTAFPLEWELNLLHQWGEQMFEEGNALRSWLVKVHLALQDTNAKYPFIAYGTDWLAFAHLVITVSFWGVFKDPVRNIWIIEFGMIACIMVIPLALIAGPVRGIPFYWQLIDCSFGIFGIIPLVFTRRLIKKIRKS